MILQKVNWQDKLKDKSVTEMVNTLNKELEDVTEKVMTKIDVNHEKICQGDGSSNKIPKQVRNLFRQKKKASDALKTVTSVKKCLAMRAKVEKAEEDLENLYKERKVKLEAAAIGKIKRNPKAFFSYAKRYSKTFCGIGPFLEENGEFLKESEAETLKKQYEKVFSKPKKDAKVENPEEFFEKSENEDEINNIHFTESDVKDAIDKLSQNAAAGPDGIPAVLIKKMQR